MYKFCDPENGRVVDRCTADPNNQPGLRLLKKKVPLDLCPNFGDRDYNRIWTDTSNPLEEHRIDIFVNENMYKSLADAANAWNGLCPSQGPDKEHQPCCLLVRWTSSIGDMGSFPDASAITRNRFHYSNPLAEENCDVDCAKSELVVNQEYDYVVPDDRGRPTRFLFTERHHVDSIPREWVYFDAYALFVHELGHWLGFNHSNEPDDEGNSCDSPGSIMEAGTDIEDRWANRLRELTWDDVCLYMKAYCCAQTKADVEEAETGSALSLSIAPNPANSELRMSFSTPINASATLRLVNAIGEIALEQRIEKETQEIALSVASVPNGWYLVEVVAGDLTLAKKVLIGD
jgi:hypothetical protein